MALPRESPPALDLRGVRTLIVDDDPNLRRILGRTLSEWGADLVEVENGARAIVELKRAREEAKPFQLILLDVSLSGVNGFEVAALLADHPAELRGVILMLDGTATWADTRRASELGVGGHLKKPLDRPALIAVVSNALGDAVRAPAAEPANDHRLRILLAEDSPDARALMAHYLHHEAFQIDPAENGAIASDLFRLAEYDLVLMDIQMPVYDGYRAMEVMRGWERQQGLRRTPIIAVTAYAQTEDAQKCLRAGFDGYLTKPLRRETLLGAIRRYVPAAARAAIEKL